MKNFLIGVLVVAVIVLGYVAFKPKETNTVNPITTTSDTTVFKSYKNQEISFKYNPEATLIDRNESKQYIQITRNPKDSEMGVVIRPVQIIDTNSSAYSSPCPQTKTVGNKVFHICEGGDTMDTTYEYFSGNKLLEIVFSGTDPQALSDNRYIDLSTIEIL